MSLGLLWRPVLKLFLGLGLGLALGGMFWACAQGEGERCERMEDCKAPLRCMKSANSIAGRCTSDNTPAPTPDAASVDTTPMQQPSTPDAGIDQAVILDSAPDTTADSAADRVDSAGG
jgi:hypothetical protein